MHRYYKSAASENTALASISDIVCVSKKSLRVRKTPLLPLLTTSITLKCTKMHFNVDERVRSERNKTPLLHSLATAIALRRLVGGFGKHRTCVYYRSHNFTSYLPECKLSLPHEREERQADPKRPDRVGLQVVVQRGEVEAFWLLRRCLLCDAEDSVWFSSPVLR